MFYLRLFTFSSMCLGVFISQVSAQTSSNPHQHPVSSSSIDGAMHPELIPDSLAYRLYFVAVSTGQNPTDIDLQRQQAHLRKIGLEADDHKTFVSVLSDFRVKYDALVDQYNASAKAAAARNEAADITGLLKALDGLVQITRDTLKLHLTSEGMFRLHAFVMSEKKNMKVEPED